MRNKTIKIGMLICLIIIAYSCRKEVFIDAGTRLDSWTKETHSNDVSPNYNVVFNQEKVNKIHLVFTAEEWTEMQAELAEINGSSGGGPIFSEQTPSYFPADFYFNGTQWYNVGVRYKGNSSLQTTSNKLPFRFKFDEFEDKYPEIQNQRFYGFKELSMSNNFNDQSLMREKSASDLFRNFGVPAVRTAFYEIYVDQGTGEYQYFGLYTMCEVVFDSFLTDYFGNETGNCYKPEDEGSKFSTAGFDLNDFEKKTNKTTGREDIQAMYDALHSSTRTSDPTAWKAGLEATFDVDGFLKYLAVNNTIQNWDTYGNMTHNYYLYNDPAMGKLRWIVWDHNEAFTSGRGFLQALPFAMNTTRTDWPLINYLINNPDYKATYKAYVKSFVNSSFATNRMSAIYNNQQSLLSTSASNEESGYTFLYGSGSFTSAVNALINHNAERVAAANSYAP